MTGCSTGKLSYVSAGEAYAVVQRMRKQQRRGRLRGDLSPYRCSVCQAWHLTSNPDAGRTRRGAA